MWSSTLTSSLLVVALTLGAGCEWGAGAEDDGNEQSSEPNVETAPAERHLQQVHDGAPGHHADDGPGHHHEPGDRHDQGE